MRGRRGRTGSQSLRVLSNPVEHSPIPELRILGFQNPVSLVGELHKLGRNLLLLKCSKELVGLADWDSIINLAMCHERWRLEVLREETGRVLLVHLRVLPRKALKLPLHEPQLFRCTCFAPQIVHTGMRYKRFEAIGMPE